MITGMTALTAGLWAAVLIGHKVDGDGVKGILLALLILTFTNIGMLILAGVVVRESRHQKRSGRRLPPSTPRAGGQAIRRQVSGASGERLSQVNPAERHTAEVQRSRSPSRIAQLATTASSGQPQLTCRRRANGPLACAY